MTSPCSNEHAQFLNCGHADSVRVRDIIKALGNQVTVGFAIDKMRCSKCRMKTSRSTGSPIQVDQLMRCGQPSKAGRVGSMTGEGRGNVSFLHIAFA